jgi:hypothetical protein
MERLNIDLVSIADEPMMFVNIRKALVCGFFMQVAHREGYPGVYITVKDYQVCCFYEDNSKCAVDSVSSCGSRLLIYTPPLE